MSQHQPDTLSQHLAHRDAPCPRCRYNLRGVTAARCPECGWALTLARLEAAEKSRPLRRACWAGFAYSLAVIGLVTTVLLFLMGNDPLDLFALWLPGAFFLVWLLLVLLWADITKRPRVPHLFVVQLFTGLSWSLGTGLLILIFAAQLLGP